MIKSQIEKNFRIDCLTTDEKTEHKKSFYLIKRHDTILSILLNEHNMVRRFSFSILIFNYFH